MKEVQRQEVENVGLVPVDRASLRTYLRVSARKVPMAREWGCKFDKVLMLWYADFDNVNISFIRGNFVLSRRMANKQRKLQCK
jgi:hypothetical protein